MKMGLLLSVYSLSAITQANKQTIYSFNDMQAPGLNITITAIYIEDLVHNVGR